MDAYCPFSREEFQIIRAIYGFLADIRYPYTIRLHPHEGSLDAAIFDALARFEVGRDAKEDEIYSALYFMPEKRLFNLEPITNNLTVSRCFRKEGRGIYTLKIPKTEMIVQCWKSPRYVKPIAERVAQELGWVERKKAQQLYLPL